MNPSPLITRDEFADFYAELHGHPPFQWQIDLANETFQVGWPDIIDVPTASGKTAAIDIAVFAAALSATDPSVNASRRIFFTVDRRQVVSQAFDHANQIANRLWKAADSRVGGQPEILRQVAACLIKLGGHFARQPPLDARELRGGIFRDDAWVRTPTQPTVIATTVDQIGSRMLFRGYGVSSRNLPIHAAMTATDALILLDEAHCSVPFLQTVQMVRNYQNERWAEEPLSHPLRLVQMSATNAKSKTSHTIFRLKDEHYAADAKLRQRHEAAKPVRLVLDDKAKAKTPAAKIAATLIGEATKLANAGCRRIAVIVNRVGIAKAVHQLFSAKHESHLLIGRMRPIDRDDLTVQLNNRFTSGVMSSIDEAGAPVFLVATQTIEVGVDYDFDGMVSQCASLDALIQRFGRLNRIGNHPHAHGVIVANTSDATLPEKLDPAKPIDPIYGNASAVTYHFLHSHAGEPEIVDFGVRVSSSVLSEDVHRPAECFITRAVAPVLMPAHVEMLVQTSPRPTLEPDVAMYLHGLGPDGKPPGQPMVQLCWRADLSIPRGPWKADSTDDPISRFRSEQENWMRTLEVCPPSAPECMSVPLREFQHWMTGQSIESRSGDVEGDMVVDDEPIKVEPKPWLRRVAMVWRGPDHSETDFVNRAKRKRETALVGGDAGDVYRNVRPNDTVVIPAQFGGWSHFGTIPDPVIDPSSEWQGIASLLGPQDSETNRQYTEQLLATIGEIDIADKAFFQKRCRNILRLHPKLPLGTVESNLLAWIRSEVEAVGHFNVRIAHARSATATICAEAIAESKESNNEAKSWQVRRLDRLLDDSLAGQLMQYPGGFVWVTGIDHGKRLGIPPLPMESFDDHLESLSGTSEVELQRHTADVMHVARTFASALGLSGDRIESLLTAATWHDIGKADPRFQAILRGQSVSLSRFAPFLLAKSSNYGRAPAGTLPANFRHEMLSTQMLDLFGKSGPETQHLEAHLIASHHGFARPFSPVCDDGELPEIDLSPLGGPVINHTAQQSWIPAHRIDSGVPDRFWQMHRQFGAWGLAQLESILRLSDWFASANPQIGDEQPAWTWRKTKVVDSQQSPCEVICDGIDGGNPLGFLSALGLFRVLHLGDPTDRFRFRWAHHKGRWRPVIVDQAKQLVDESSILGFLVDRWLAESDSHPSLAECQTNLSRHDWFEILALESSLLDRVAVDWVTCNGSDALGPEAISQLQTSRRDYHSIAIKGLLAATNVDHLRRTLFAAWDYADPIAGVSLHLEPREDRRHAYQWHTPSGDPTRKVNGGMIGANCLALEAWPLFQSLPRVDRMQTVSFRGWRVSDTSFLWPIWERLISLATVQAILNNHRTMETQQRVMIGLPVTYSSKRILVGKTPNLTAAVAL